MQLPTKRTEHAQTTVSDEILDFARNTLRELA
jgi:hypothetical protein